MGQALGCVRVHESTVAVKEHHGNFDELLEPGDHYVPRCFGYKVVGSVDLRIRQLDVRLTTMTKDEVFVTVGASILYRASAEKADDAFYTLPDSNAYLQTHALYAMGTIVGRVSMVSVFEQSKAIAKAVNNVLQKVISAYGFEILETIIRDTQPDDRAKPFMVEIYAAARMMLGTDGLEIRRAEEKLLNRLQG